MTHDDLVNQLTPLGWTPIQIQGREYWVRPTDKAWMREEQVVEMLRQSKLDSCTNSAQGTCADGSEPVV